MAMNGEIQPEEATRESVLSPVDRVSEMLFGLFMALTFVGAVSVAEAGRAQIRDMFVAALGCNLAWGLVDAIMYLVRTVTDRGRSLMLVHSVRAAPDAATGRRLLERLLSRAATSLVSPAELESRVHDGRARHGTRDRDQRARRMNAALRAVVAFTIVMATTALAGEDEGSGRRASPVTKPSWEFAITAYPTLVRGGENYTSAIAVADRGPLHIEARYNYESVGARSAFVGWTFSGEEALTWELTPLLGGAWGTTQAFVPALEASGAW